MKNATYAAAAAAEYRRATVDERFAPEAREMASAMADVVKEAVHFILPDNGTLMDDELKGLRGTQPRLPFPAVTLSYVLITSDGSAREDMLIVAWEDRGSVRLTTVVHRPWYGVWSPMIGMQIIPDDWDVSGRAAFDMNVMFPSLIPTDPAEVADTMEFEGAVAKVSVRVLLEFCEAAACSNVHDRVVRKSDPRVNARRERKGKLPLYETRVLAIDLAKGAAGAVTASDPSDRRRPRRHLRRGHIRRLGDGRTVWVQSCTVGAASIGRIDKDYLVIGGEV